VPRRAWWRCDPEVIPWLREADRLVTNISLLDGYRARREQERRPPAARALARIRRRWEPDRARMRDAVKLRRALVMIALTAGDEALGVPGVGPLITQARELRGQAEELQSALATSAARLARLRQELGERAEARRRMSFDSLYLAACFSLRGPPAVQSPFETEAGEVVYLATGAAMTRLRGWRSPRRPAAAVPMRYTGIRGWVGTIRDRPAPRRPLTRIDEGTLVVSSRRLVFVGRTEWIRLAFASVSNLDVYRDGVAVFRPGHADPYLFLVEAPGEVAFYISVAG
jgi:hypothetical protein